jgi:SAM-dependent methyltransferase
MNVEGHPLSWMEQAAALGRETLRICATLARHGRVRRDAERVALEYDGGYWTDVLASRRWERAGSLQEFITPRQAGERVARIEGRLVRVSHETYYQFRSAMLRQVLLECAGQAPALAELGCGYGANLFALAPLDRWRPLIGFEISETALTAAERISAHFGLGQRLEFHRLDLLDGAAPAFKYLAGRTAFTYYCLEQLKHATSRVIENLARAGVSRVIHIEPTPELWGLWPPADAVSRLYSWSQQYQDNLLTTLRACERRGAVRLLTVRRLNYAPTVRHDPALICWEPTGS